MTTHIMIHCLDGKERGCCANGTKCEWCGAHGMGSLFKEKYCLATDCERVGAELVKEKKVNK